MNKAIILNHFNQGSFRWYSRNSLDIRTAGLQEILVFDEHEDDEVEWGVGHAAICSLLKEVRVNLDGILKNLQSVSRICSYQKFQKDFQIERTRRFRRFGSAIVPCWAIAGPMVGESHALRSRHPQTQPLMSIICVPSDGRLYVLWRSSVGEVLEMAIPKTKVSILNTV